MYYESAHNCLTIARRMHQKPKRRRILFETETERLQLRTTQTHIPLDAIPCGAIRPQRSHSKRLQPSCSIKHDYHRLQTAPTAETRRPEGHTDPRLLAREGHMRLYHKTLSRYHYILTSVCSLCDGYVKIANLSQTHVKICRKPSGNARFSVSMPPDGGAESTTLWTTMCITEPKVLLTERLQAVPICFNLRSDLTI